MRVGYKWSFLASMSLAGGMVAVAQTTPAPTPKNPISTKPEGTGVNCSYSGSKSSDGTSTSTSNCPQQNMNPTQRFPYPGETASPVTPAPATDAPQPTNGANGASGSQGSAGQRFPYPGEGANSPLKDAGSSGTSNSSSSSSSSGTDDAPPPDTANGDNGDNLPAPKRARKKLPPVPRQSPDEREEEDVRVAGFYQNDGNYRAAYMRAKDAVGIDDTDAEAHFALAEAARKLGKLDEAQQQYKKCLELDPVPKLKKDSEKALKDMAGS